MPDFVLVPRPTGPGVTEYALASFLARYRGGRSGPTSRTCWRSCAGALPGS